MTRSKRKDDHVALALQQEIQQTPTKSDLKKAQESATAWLTNGKGYKVERRDDFGRVIDTLYMDTPDIETAVNIMRVGQSGIGFSHNGVNGPYESAWTIDGKFNADWIYTGTLYGLLFKAGIIESIDGKIKIDLSDDLSEPTFNTGISTNGLTVRADEVGAEKLLHIYAKKSTGGANFGRLEFFSVNGKKLATLTEVFSDSNSTNPVGMTFELDSQNGSTGAFIGTGNTESGFYVVSGGFNSGYFVSNGDFESKLRTTIINEKRISWEYSSELGKYVLCGS